MNLLCNEIVAAFAFARDYLGIQSKTFLWDWDVRSWSVTLGYHGAYYPERRRILFNGDPSLDTIFHEAVHYWQHEQGDDFTSLRAVTVETGSDAAHQAYLSCPREIEARGKAREMAVAYRDKLAGFPHWA